MEASACSEEIEEAGHKGQGCEEQVPDGIGQELRLQNGDVPDQSPAVPGRRRGSAGLRVWNSQALYLFAVRALG